MRKLTAKIILICLIISLLIFALAACNKDNPEPVYLTIDGDIEGGLSLVDLTKLEKVDYTYTDDGAEVSAQGYKLAGAMGGINMLYPNNRLMITASDGVSAILEYPLTSDVYIYINEDGNVCAKGINYPKVVGIKDIAEITVITKDEANSGYKILNPSSETSYISRGNAKLKLFTFVANNLFKGNSADKYTKTEQFNVKNFTEQAKNIVYFEDYDILNNAQDAVLNWKNGKLVCLTNNNYKPVFGFATGADKLITDAFFDMKSELDNGGKVMFILPDGFSLEQAKHFRQELTTLKYNENTKIAASTHLSISPVALAAIVTGQAPSVNGVHFNDGESRAILPLAVDDIFKYATSIGKSVSYIEGKGNLILTSVSPKYSISDNQAYQNGLQAINEGKDLIFIHFHETDDVNHEYGPLSNQSKTKLLETEQYIANLIARFDGKVIVVPDHGHNTLLDAEGKQYGKHGMFTSLDMFVPYYVFGGLI